MDAVHIHLMLNHLPVLATPLGFILLLFGFVWKNRTLRTTALGLFVLAAVAVIPVYLTGEPAEEVVESLPGVQEGIIDQHSDLGKLGFIGSGVLGLLALVVLIRYRGKSEFPVQAGILLLATSAISCGVLIQTAYLGGQVRHTEIRAGSVTPVQAVNEKENEARE